MRTSLRRSCNACAKAKHRCDLQIPQCSRCMKRQSRCLYTNEPATSRPHDASPGTSGIKELALKNDSDFSAVTGKNNRATPIRFESLVRLENPSNEYLDPFSVYPTTRLARTHVQRLIHHFLSNIAFQYYPLDLHADSNPFLVSWWPLALQDPALFHVSLQTASLDEEVRARKGFPISELLMADSVSLVRRKIEDSSLAFQDETLNSVVTLAAIEHGKGHIQASRMHIDGVKRIVDVRGGIDKVKCSSPLTARMVSWVSLLLTGTPQFQTQDDSGDRTGIGPIPQWHLASKDKPSQQLTLDHLDINPVMSNILSHLRNIFHDPQLSNLTTTELHDLTCYVVHKLLLLPPFSTMDTKHSSASDCLRYALALYMLIIHGTTYYSHVDLAKDIMLQFQSHLKTLIWTNEFDSLKLWFISIGMAAAGSTADRQWFLDQASIATTALGLQVWDGVLLRLQSILWIRMQQGALFQQRWEEVLISLKD